MAPGRKHESGNQVLETRITVDIVAQQSGVTVGRVRVLEQRGLIAPEEIRGRQHLYSPAAIEEVRRIERLRADLQLNLDAIEIVLQMRERMIRLQQEIERLRRETGTS